MSFMATWDTTPMDGELGRVEDLISGMNRVAVCFSGGLDSTVLADIAYRTIGNRAVAIMADVPMMSNRQRDHASRIADSIGIRMVTVPVGYDDMPSILCNGEDRCYICKTAMYRAIVSEARGLGIGTVVNGEIVDDLDEFRPGMRAGTENGILRPFVDAGVGRDAIVGHIVSMDLPVGIVKDTCMLMRYPIGVPVTDVDLGLVEDLESGIRDVTGLSQLRVRWIDGVFSVQTSPSERHILDGYVNDVGSVFSERDLRFVIDPEDYDK